MHLGGASGGVGRGRLVRCGGWCGEVLRRGVGAVVVCGESTDVRGWWDSKESGCVRCIGDAADHDKHSCLTCLYHRCVGPTAPMSKPSAAVVKGLCCVHSGVTGSDRR